MTEDEITRRVREYINENFLYMRPDLDFSVSDSLLESGIIDSMGVIELVSFVQDQFAIRIDDGDITEENIGTLSGITQYVQKKVATDVLPA